MNRANALRTHAEEFRRLAQTSGTAWMRKQLEQLASQCEALAEIAEGGAAEAERQRLTRLSGE